MDNPENTISFIEKMTVPPNFMSRMTLGFSHANHHWEGGLWWSRTCPPPRQDQK